MKLENLEIRIEGFPNAIGDLGEKLLAEFRIPLLRDNLPLEKGKSRIKPRDLYFMREVSRFTGLGLDILHSYRAADAIPYVNLAGTVLLPGTAIITFWHRLSANTAHIIETVTKEYGISEESIHKLVEKKMLALRDSKVSGHKLFTLYDVLVAYKYGRGAIPEKKWIDYRLNGNVPKLPKHVDNIQPATEEQFAQFFGKKDIHDYCVAVLKDRLATVLYAFPSSPDASDATEFQTKFRQVFAKYRGDYAPSSTDFHYYDAKHKYFAGGMTADLHQPLLHFLNSSGLVIHLSNAVNHGKGFRDKREVSYRTIIVEEEGANLIRQAGEFIHKQNDFTSVWRKGWSANNPLCVFVESVDKFRKTSI